MKPEELKAIEEVVELVKEKTITDVYDTLDDDQKKVVNFLVAMIEIKTENRVTRKIKREFDILRCAKKIKRCCSLTKDCSKCPLYRVEDHRCSIILTQEPQKWEV